MSYILVIWTVVAGAGTQHSSSYKYDWRAIGEIHGTAATCHAVASELRLAEKASAAIAKATGGQA